MTGRRDRHRGDASEGPSPTALALILAVMVGVSILGLLVLGDQTSSILNTVSGRV